VNKILSGGVTRRNLLKTSAAAALIGAVRTTFPSGAFAATNGAEVTGAKLGYIALTDAAPLVIAKEKGLFEKHGLPDVDVAKQASWGATRDNLVLGGAANGIDGAHILSPLPYLMHTGKVTQNNQPVPMAILARLNYDSQGISVAKEYADTGVQLDASKLKAAFDAKRAAGKEIKAAMTFPGGTHDLWIRYWLAAGGIDPDKDVSTIVVPPPQMVMNMKIGNMSGFCVGEPWNQRAISDNIGFTAATSQQIWPEHPEKVLGTRAQWVKENPNTARALTAAVLEAARWIDASDDNRRETAQVLAGRAWINTKVETLQGRMLGQYQNGLGQSWQDAHPMRFFDNGNVSFPWLSDGMWFLTQMKRWGLLASDPDYLTVARQINRIDIYKQAASAVGQIALPASEMRSSTLIDGKVWDGSNPAAYAASFAIKR